MPNDRLYQIQSRLKNVQFKEKIASGLDDPNLCTEAESPNEPDLLKNSITVPCLDFHVGEIKHCPTSF